MEELRHSDQRDSPLQCSECNTSMVRSFENYRLSKACNFLWNGGEPLTLEHAADHPITFNSQKELKSFCKENGFSSGAIL